MYFFSDGWYTIHKLQNKNIAWKQAFEGNQYVKYVHWFVMKALDKYF